MTVITFYQNAINENRYELTVPALTPAHVVDERAEERSIPDQHRG